MKLSKDMTFNEFKDWATGYLILEIGRGRSIQEIMFLILNQALLNEVWGSKKKK